MSDVKVTLGLNRYGKGDVRILRIVKDTPKHEVYVKSTLIYFVNDNQGIKSTNSSRRRV